jgi:hypothetical protein
MEWSAALGQDSCEAHASSCRDRSIFYRAMSVLPKNSQNRHEYKIERPSHTIIFESICLTLGILFIFIRISFARGKFLLLIDPF